MLISDWSSDVCSSDLYVASATAAPPSSMPSQTISPVALAVAWSSSVRTTDPSASTTTALTMAAPESVKSTVASSWTPSPFGVRYTSAGPSELIDTGLATSISTGAPVHVTYWSSAET